VDAEGAGEGLDAEGEAPRGLAIHVDQHVAPGVEGLGLDDAAATGEDLGVVEVRTFVERGGQGQFLGEGHVAQDDDLELAVGEIGVGGDQHAATEVAPVGDGDVEYGALVAGFTVDLQANLLVLVAQGGAQGAEEESGLAAEPFGALVDELVGVAADAEAGDVEEGAEGRGALRVGEPEEAEVNGARGAPEATDRLFQAPREAEGALEVAAGASGDDGEGRAIEGGSLRGEVSLHGFVQGAVAAHHGQGLHAVFAGAAGEIAGLSGAGCLDDIVLEALAAQRFAQALELAQGGAGASFGVEQDADRGGCHGQVFQKMRVGSGALLDGPRAQRIVVIVSGPVTYTNNISVRLNPRRKQKVHGR
jgi:hypothetical protein